MTYPQQQYPPQGYAPAPAQPQYAPQGYAPPPPPAQPQYAPQPQQAQPPAIGGTGLQTPTPPLATGGSASGGAWPKARHLQGCTFILEPIRVDETKTAIVKQNGVNTVVPRPEAYFHLTIVDAPGGKIQYGNSEDLDPAKQRPNVWERDVPCRFTNCNDYGYGFVNETRAALAAGEEGRVGVVERGTEGNRPYLVTRPDKMVGGADRPGGAERFEKAAYVWNLVYGSTHGGAPFDNPAPRSLMAAPAQQPQQVAYAQPAQSPAPYTMPQPPQHPYPGLQPGYAVPAAFNPAAAAQYGPATGQPYTAPQAYGMAAPQQPAYAPPPQGHYAPPSPFEAWIASLPIEQQAGARAQYAQQQPGVAGPGI